MIWNSKRISPSLWEVEFYLILGASTSLLGEKIYEMGDDYFHKDGLCSNQQKYYHIVKNFFPYDQEYEEIMNRK